MFCEYFPSHLMKRQLGCFLESHSLTTKHSTTFMPWSGRIEANPKERMSILLVSPTATGSPPVASGPCLRRAVRISGGRGAAPGEYHCFLPVQSKALEAKLFLSAGCRRSVESVREWILQTEWIRTPCHDTHLSALQGVRAGKDQGLPASRRFSSVRNRVGGALFRTSAEGVRLTRNTLGAQLGQEKTQTNLS